MGIKIVPKFPLYTLCEYDVEKAIWKGGKGGGRFSTNFYGFILFDRMWEWILHHITEGEEMALPAFRLLSNETFSKRIFLVFDLGSELNQWLSTYPRDV